MLKKILAVVAMLYAAASFAAVDVNKATAADLDGIKGIGPAISTKILDERKKGNFKDWPDFIERTKGVGENNAAKFSAEGMTVNGEGFKGAAAAPAKVDAKKTVKADAKAAPVAAAAPAAPAATMAKADTKPTTDEAKAKKAADKQAKADAKKAKADEAKAKKDANKDAKPDTMAAAKPAAAASAAK